MDQPEVDLVMVPTDGHFEPYEYKTSDQPTSKTNGRIFVLKFSSSSQRHLFWLQSKSQSRTGDPSWFSPRDLKIGQIVDTLLQGDEVDVPSEIAQIQGNERRDDDDETMEDVEGHPDPSHTHHGSGGAGPGATGGDIREEGEQAREGGADGGRA
jgi:26S proteasome regulatory subunit N13